MQNKEKKKDIYVEKKKEIWSEVALLCKIIEEPINRHKFTL